MKLVKSWNSETESERGKVERVWRKRKSAVDGFSLKLMYSVICSLDF